MEISILNDRYEINQQLSRKAGRQTLLALDRETGEQVVIKLLTFSSEFEWESLKLFERETQTLKTLSHPTIPKYLNSFELNEEDTKGFALVQTYIAAPSLESHIKSGRTFSEVEIKQIAESLLETLIYLHTQHPPVIHRDIKPSNVLLVNRSGNYVGQTYLVDFGAVQTAAFKNSDSFTVVGTYGYMPPEQFSGRTTPVSDLYSLGATLIYLVTGQHPANLMTDDLQLEFGQSTTLSPELTRWLQRLVQPTPSQRFANASEALEALKNPQVQELELPQSNPLVVR
ncbi:MAG: serine/threonine protein kinase [Microcoleus sp. SU_5_3]|nr:serine/threonine protein kinase [Microcoleus sp. SU_5_3]